MKQDAIYGEVTEKIVSAIEAGAKNWQSPYISRGIAKNYFSGHEYAGINFLLLNFCSKKVPLYGTFLQIKNAGGYVKAGSKAEKVIFSSMLFKHNGKTIDIEQAKQLKERGENVDTTFIKKVHSVFSLQDTDGIDYSEAVKGNTDTTPIEAAEAIVRGYKGAPLIISKNQFSAFYRPSQDVVNMPEMKNIKGANEYYSTLFHELVHSTGHKTRLNREGVAKFDSFGSEKYAFEELIAELGAAFLSAKVGIELIDNNAAYIGGWSERLKKDNTLIFKAAAAAQKAVEHIIG